MSVPRRRKPVLILATVLLVLGLVEGGARVLEAISTRENPFVSATNVVRAFERVTENGVEVYRRSPHMDEWIYRDLQFPVYKSPETLRVFCLGGSATMGWPYENAHSYPGYLERKLRRLVPGRKIEVVNLAGFSFASYRVKVLFDEVIEYDPDLVLLYSGNNEFLENFVYRSKPPSARLPFPLRRLALVRIPYDAWDRTRTPPIDVDIGNFAASDHISNRLSFAFGKASRLAEDPEQLEQVVAHYRFNLDAITRTCLERGVAIHLLNVPVNLRDWNPNVSRHDPSMTGEDRQRWQTRFREGVLALEGGDPARARAALDEAVALDPIHAETHFQRGHALLRLGDAAAAKEEFVRALVHDAFPFRALPRFETIIAEIAAEHGVPLVDSIAALEQETADGILGLDLLLDYVHLTARGNEIVAQEVARSLQAQGTISAGADLAAVRLPVPEGLDDSPSLLARLYEQFRVMRQYDRLEGLADRLLAQSAPDARRVQDRVRASQRVIMPYRDLLRAERLGLLEREYQPQEAQVIVQAYVDLTRALEAGTLSNEEFRRYVPEFEYRTADGSVTKVTVDELREQAVTIGGETYPVEWTGNERRVLFPTGGVYSEGVWVGGKREGLHRGYHPGGKLRITAEWQSGRKHGLYQTFHENGTLLVEGYYEGDLQTGLWTTYHPDGSVQSRGHFDRGQRTNDWKFFDPEGRLDPERSGAYTLGMKVSP